jgi:rRNA maturation endonuclease Nob1
MKYYYCPMLKEGRGCRYGGNKKYNFGFMSGTDSFCRLVKKWVHDLKTCPRKCTACSGRGFAFTDKLEKHICDVCGGKSYLE